MKDTKSDLRTKKTYNALFIAFRQLLLEKSFEEISVRELCDLAQTRTATFYNHFDDKYDFVSFMINEKRKAAFTEITLEYDKDKPASYYAAILDYGFSFLTENSDFLMHMESDTMLSTIMNSMSESIYNTVYEHVVADIQSGKLKNTNPELITHFIVGGTVGGSRWWLRNKKKISLESLKKELLSIINTVMDY
jgi:AcrR family transcriptional regulator